MSRYELVVLLDPTKTKADLESVIKEIEGLVGKSNIKEKDEIGMLDLVYEIKGNPRAYFLSYDVHLETNKIAELKKKFNLMKTIMRFFFYKMTEKEKFLKFADVYEEIGLSEEEKARLEEEKAFKDMDSKRNVWAKKK